MKHIGLFEGIGGFSLAAHWMGWETIAWCEWNEFGQKVLKHHFPKAQPHGDITKTDFTIYRGQCDIVTGGFPCQPYSLAGKRKGKEDDRHLWPEMLRAITEIQPTWVVGENVFGLVNWDGGLVFHEVQTDLEAAGYEVFPYVLPAVSVNAPHRRDRIWFVAYAKSSKCRKQHTENRRWKDRQFGNNGKTKTSPNPNRNGLNGSDCQHEINTSEGRQYAQCNIEQMDSNDAANSKSESSRGELQQRQGQGEFGGCDSIGNAADTDSGRQPSKEHGQTKSRRITETSVSSDWQNFPTQSPICAGNDGVSAYSHDRTIQNENTMDRTLVIKSAIDAGRLIADIETGKIYSTVTKSNIGDKVELKGADCNGYRVHNISFGGIKKQCRAHQIVWIYANGVYDKEVLMIDHINRDKSDNRLSNLRLVDAKGNRENVNEYEGKLTQDEKDTMYFIYAEGHMSIRELAEDFGISKSRVQQLLSEHKGLDSITFPKWRNESIKAAGNAIVPQVAYQIFKTIKLYNAKL